MTFGLSVILFLKFILCCLLIEFGGVDKLKFVLIKKLNNKIVEITIYCALKFVKLYGEYFALYYS